MLKFTMLVSARRGRQLLYSSALGDASPCLGPSTLAWNKRTDAYRIADKAVKQGTIGRSQHPRKRCEVQAKCSPLQPDPQLGAISIVYVQRTATVLAETGSFPRLKPQLPIALN
jgi:hypothetical protein